MKALVIYESEFGNTAKVAQAIGKGLSAQQPVEVQHVKDAPKANLTDFDLIVVGGPTQRMNYTEGMRLFLESIPKNGLSGVKIAAFDTRISIDDVQSTVERFAARLFLHRYAAKPIANVLKEKGGKEVIEPEGFYVLDTEGPLKEGELGRAEAWGQQVLQKGAV